MDMKHLAIRIGPHHSQQTYINTAQKIKTQQLLFETYYVWAQYPIPFFVLQQSTSNRHEDYIM